MRKNFWELDYSSLWSWKLFVVREREQTVFEYQLISHTAANVASPGFFWYKGVRPRAKQKKKPTEVPVPKKLYTSLKLFFFLFFFLCQPVMLLFMVAAPLWLFIACFFLFCRCLVVQNLLLAHISTLPLSHNV